MKAFHTVAIPDDDILEGRLTMDVFAADLWEVFKRRGPDEYKDPKQFFKKTFETDGLANLLAVVGRRLAGNGGDPVIQIQTPFGGGKTHALIAMYHNSSKWKAQNVVIVGTAMAPRETLWGALERQLTGKLARFKEPVSPGREAIQELLGDKQPVLILMDEVLEYITKAAGIRVEESTLAAQSVAFIQELTEVAGTLGRVCLVLTLPSSILEHYDERAEKLFQQLQKVAGRVEKIYTPVQEHEISSVIRQRLFSSVDKEGTQGNIQEFIDYATRESILPPETEPSVYAQRFEESFPFLPGVIDVLYQRWGSFPTFQRTRGVLRLLALVVQSLSDARIPHISLADFDLENQEIRRELLKHIGNEFDSVIASDLTGTEAGARQVDSELGKSYQGLRLGRRAATSIFMHSFSGGPERGATLAEIKRSATTLQNPSSVIAEALEQLKGKLFYLQDEGGKYFFTNQPNLNKALLVKMENIEDSELTVLELDLLKENISGKRLRVSLWPEKSSEIDENVELKLVVLQEHDADLMQDILENKGNNPRVNRNTLIFLTPREGEKIGFQNMLRKQLAYQRLSEDSTLTLSREQAKQIKSQLKKSGEAAEEGLKRYYRSVAVPSKTGFREMDLGIPTYGEKRKIDEEVYDTLRSGGEILEKVAPLVIKAMYLKDSNHVSTEQMYSAGLTTPGQTRVVDRSGWEVGIDSGVRDGIFGLGELEAEEPVCHYFNKKPFIGFAGKEVLIREEICRQQMREAEVGPVPVTGTTPEPTGGAPPDEEGIERTGRGKVELSFPVPRGKVSNLMGVMHFLEAKFSKLEISLLAEDGTISDQEYEDKIREAFRQMGIDIGE